MKILIYGINYAPELTGIGRYTGDLAKWLQSRGHQIRVVTAPPYYPAWQIADSHRNGYSREDLPGNPMVFRCPLYVPDKPTGLKRVAHLASFMLGSIPVMLRMLWWKPDVVFTIEPTFFCAPVALLVARATGSIAWLHIQDFEVDAAFDLGILPSEGIIHGAALCLETFFTQKFHNVSSISANMVQRLRAKGIPANKTILFENWVDINAIESQTPRLISNQFRRQLGLDGKVILLYSGNMGAKQGLESLAPLAASFSGDARVHFVFCGDGSYRPYLEESVRDLKNVTMLPLQSHEKLNELLNAADIHLLPQRSGAADLVMPSKLTGMLASGRPVIATADPGTQIAVVLEGQGYSSACGLAVPPGDQPALQRAVQTLVESAETRNRFGLAARKYAVDHLGKDAVLLRFERQLQRACSLRLIE